MKAPSINYRNAKYQGDYQPKTFLPYKRGIVLDENMNFIVSTFEDGQATGPTLIFYHHAKYIYGQWLNGSPHGLNVFRSGDTIIFAFYERGNIVEKFLVIFEPQNLAVTVEMAGGSCSIISRKENLKSQEEIRTVINETRFQSRIPQEYFSLITFIEKYLKEGFIFQHQGREMTYFFGYPQGLGIVFDANNFIEIVGVLDKSKQLCGLGGKFSLNASSEGNFDTDQLVKYNKNARPIEKIKSMFRKSQAQELFFRNDFLLNNFNKTMLYVENILRQKLISQVAQQQLEDSIRYTHQDFNDSLEYQPRPINKNDGERLKRMKEQLQRSIRPGADVVVSPKKEYNSGARSPIRRSELDDIPNIAIARPRAFEISPQRRQPPYPTITVNRQTLLDENLLQDYQVGAFKYENLQQRRDRVLNDYRYMKADYPLAAGAPLPPPPVVVSVRPLYQSPGRNFLLDSEREIVPLSSSRRTPVVPILHQRPVVANFSPARARNQNPSKSPLKSTKYDSYKKIHMRESEPNGPLKETPVKALQGREFGSTRKDPRESAQPTLTRDRSVKKYNYLEGLER